MPTRTESGRPATPSRRPWLAAHLLWLAGLIGPAGLLALGGAALTPMLAWAEEAPFVEKLADRALLERLRGGGYVLYLRHGLTDNSRADQVPEVDLNDCATQRVLNAEGRQQATAVGQAITRAGIPIAEIHHSPLCRTSDTVKLAFPQFKGPISANRDLMYTANLTSAQKVPVLAATRRLVSAPAPAGSNRLIVAHAPNMADLMGYFVKPEGTLVVLRPVGDGHFEYLASIPPKHWAQLLR